MIDYDAIDAALRSAMPVLAVTAFPVLTITAGVALWVRSQIPAEPDDDFSVDDYAAPAVGTATVRHLRPVEAATEVVQLAAWDVLPPAPAGPGAGTPLWAELTARRVLNELGQQAQTQVTA